MRAPDIQHDSLRDFFLEANPNPERIGCPLEDILQAVAENRVGVDHPARLHLAVCSECFAEFRAYKVEWEQKRSARLRTIGWAVAAGVLIAVVGGAIAINHHKRQTMPEEQLAKSIPPILSSPLSGRDLSSPTPKEKPHPVPPKTKPKPHGSRQETLPEPDQNPLPPLREDNEVPNGPPRTHPPAPVGISPSITLDLTNVETSEVLKRARSQLEPLRATTVNLSLYLPHSSEEGRYEVRLASDVSGLHVLATTSGHTLRLNEKLFLPVKLMLADVPNGDYYLLIVHEDDEITHAYAIRVEPMN